MFLEKVLFNLLFNEILFELYKIINLFNLLCLVNEVVLCEIFFIKLLLEVNIYV